MAIYKVTNLFEALPITILSPGHMNFKTLLLSKRYSPTVNGRV